MGDKGVVHKYIHSVFGFTPISYNHERISYPLLNTQVIKNVTHNKNKKLLAGTQNCAFRWK